jgi:hypothetical protein
VNIEASVSAREFVLLDADDRPVIAMAPAPGGAGLVFLDGSGTQRMVLGIDEDGPVIQMRGEDGANALVIGFPRPGEPAIRLMRPGASESVTVAITAPGPTVLFTRDGVVRASITLADDGPHVLLSDFAGVARVEVAQTNSDGPRMTTFDPEGRPTWGVP